MIIKTILGGIIFIVLITLLNMRILQYSGIVFHYPTNYIIPFVMYFAECVIVGGAISLLTRISSEKKEIIG